MAQSPLLLRCRNKPWSAMAMAPATGHCHPVTLLYCMVSSLLELNQLYWHSVSLHSKLLMNSTVC